MLLNEKIDELSAYQLAGAFIKQSLILGFSEIEKKNKIFFALYGSIIQLWCDCSQYDEYRIRKKIIEVNYFNGIENIISENDVIELRKYI